MFSEANVAIRRLKSVAVGRPRDAGCSLLSVV